ncbi:MAG: sugar kinase [Phycisphaerales bacterium]|nr:sugar kinase [Phycisphaerales bacterium]
MRLAVTGTIGIDTVYTPRDRREGAPGGSAAYFSAAASFMAPVRLVAVVGDDWPAEHRAALAGFAGVDLAGLEVRPGARTFAWGGKYADDPNVRETMFTQVGVLEERPPVVPHDFRDSELVFLANTHPAVQLGFIDQFPSRKLVVADTMNLWIQTAHSELMDLLKRVDGVILNDSEAAMITGSKNPVTAGRGILEHGPSFAIVKKGEHGAVLIHRDGLAVIPAFPADESQVIDPTGAGDAFAGGVMGALAKSGRTDMAAVQDGMAWGTVLASFTIEAFGLERLQALQKSELLQRHARMRDIARFG